MTIGSPSGSGATQNEIADGADESNGRWQTLFARGLTTASDTQITTGGSGAVPSFTDAGFTASSGTDGDFGFVICGSFRVAGSGGSINGSALIKATYQSGVSIANLSDDHVIGLANNGDNPGDQTNVACFRPAAGDSTSGNVRVHDGTSNVDGSISYPTITDLNTYTVLIDAAGDYLTAGHTGFYVNGDPRRGDSPDADLAALPDPTAARKFGVFYGSEGNDQFFSGNYLEVGTRR